MSRIVLATLNRDKLREIQGIWRDISNIELDWLGNYPDLKGAEETGKTLYENASIKAKYVSKALGCTAVADDTGFFVEYLNGAPGVYSSRYSGPGATYEDNVRKLLSELKGVPKEKRKAEFKCVVCLCRDGKDDIFTEGTIKGSVTDTERGRYGFGYDPVFEVGGTGRTFAQMPIEEKNSISHRYIAFKKMGEFLSSVL